MESNRQKKISKILQQDLAEILQGAARKGGLRGIIISVSKVSVTTDLSIAKVHLSVFPSDKRNAIIEGVKSNSPLIRHELAKRTRNQLRRMPELLFFGDDSLDYIEKIDRALEATNNPINPSK